MDEQTCSECGRTLPLNEYQLTRWGNRFKICRECVAAHRKETIYENRQKKAIATEYNDPEFDDKAPVEVIETMSRAKRWLESRGYTIRLEGEYVETKVHKIAFNR